MPIIKANDVTPERPVIVVLYGVPGSKKTSTSTTAENPILIDTDRGYDRAVQRVDTITAQKWTDITSEMETIKQYKTVIVDTAKATLDDYLAVYVCDQNYKLKTNALKRFGQMADEFKQFVNILRANGQDIIFICHDKETAEGDTIKHSPDCTGQSKDLLLRIADQVGFISIRNKESVIDFTPSDNYVTKNVAELEPLVIPDVSNPEFPTFMAGIIKQVKSAIQSKSEAQRKAKEQLEGLRAKVAEVETLEDIEAILTASKELPPVMKVPFFSELKESLKQKGFSFDSKTKKFVKDEPSDSKGVLD